MKNNTLSKHIEKYFSEYLVTHKGMRPNTIKAYRDVIKLFLLFMAKKTKKPVVKIDLNDLPVDLVLNFLKDIESKRNNSPSTRNH